VRTKLFAVLWVVQAAAVLGLLPRVAAAEDSAYCRKVRARATGDAALLMAPRVVGQAIRFPSDGVLDPATGTHSQRTFEFRAGLSVAPVDFLRGFAVQRVADADCSQHGVGERLDEVLRHDIQPAELPARRAELEYLNARRPEWRTLLEAGENRLKAGMITVMELHDLRRLCDELERRTVNVEAQLARLDTQLNADRAAAGLREGAAPVRVSAKDYVARTRTLEREVSSLRSFDAWSFKVTGGVVPNTDTPVDWFGYAELTYSLGGPVHTRAESRYLAARGEELRAESQELPGKFEQFRKLVEVTRGGALRELEAVESALEHTQRTLGQLQGFDAPDAVQGRARLTVERIGLQADAAFLRTEVHELDSLLERTHES